MNTQDTIMQKPNENELAQAIETVKKRSPFGSGAKKKRIESVISMLPNESRPEVSILSVGAGSCEIEAVLSELGYNISAIDDLEEHWHLVGENQNRIKKFADRMDIELYVAKAGADILNNREFDVVLCLNVIEHLDTPRELLNYVGGKLHDGGIVIISTPNSAHLANRIKLLIGKSISTRHGYLFWNPGEFRTHIKEYTSSELQEVLEWSNYDVIEHNTINQLLQYQIQQARENNKRSTLLAARVYNLITNLNSSFRDTQIISARKPEKWEPVEASVSQFSNYHPNIQRNNMDDIECDEIKRSIQKTHKTTN